MKNMLQNFKIYKPERTHLEDIDSYNLFCDVRILFNDKLVQLAKIDLSSFILFLIQITDSLTVLENKVHSFKIDGENSYKIVWDINSKFNIYQNEKELIKTTMNYSFYILKNQFYFGLMNYFFDRKLINFANRYGNEFFDYYSITSSKFRISDKVRTIKSKNVKTVREGYIIDKFFHSKENKFKYNLLIDKKIYKKRYNENDLERID